MTDNIDIFSLLLLISFLWYIFYKNTDNTDRVNEPFICGRPENPFNHHKTPIECREDDPMESCLESVDPDNCGQGCPGGGCPKDTIGGGKCGPGSSGARGSMFYSNGGFISPQEANFSKRQYIACRKKCDSMKCEPGNFSDIANKYNQCLVSCCNYKNDNPLAEDGGGDDNGNGNGGGNPYQRGFKDAMDILNKKKGGNKCNIDINYNSDKFYCSDYGSHKEKYGDSVPSKMLVKDKYGSRYHVFHDSDICCSNSLNPEDNFKKGYTKCCSFYNNDDIINPKNCENVKLQ